MRGIEQERQREDAEVTLNDVNEALDLLDRLSECTESMTVRGYLEDINGIMEQLREERDDLTDAIMRYEDDDRNAQESDYWRAVI